MLRVQPARALPLLLVLALAVALVPAAASPADASTDYRQVVNITFPVADPDRLTTFRDDYDDCRGGAGCPRRHRATDIGGGRETYGLPIHASMGGTINWITGLDGASPHATAGYAIGVRGDDGRTYRYMHLGRNDGPTGEAYASGMRLGARVERGQHIGFLGYSGNASASWPHLHFEIIQSGVQDPYGTDRINPFFSLQDAVRRGDLPTGSVARVNRTRFSDVPADHPHASGIAWVAEQGITRGCATPGHYCPSNGVTRGQMATFLMLAGKLPDGGPHGFSDVPAGHPHERGIAAIKAAGITSGVGGGRFDPQGIVRRDQMATFLRNALDLPDSNRRYPDVHPSSPHAAAIGAIGDARITTGYKDGTYRPELTVTRAQMATFLQAADAAR